VYVSAMNMAKKHIQKSDSFIHFFFIYLKNEGDATKMQAFQSGTDLPVLQDGHVRNACHKAEINLMINSELYHTKLLPAVQT
jgi:hypothetical protein